MGKLLPKDYQEQIKKIIRQLKETHNVGKPLGYPFFREKKIGKYGVYFLVYEDIDTVLLITISDKKTQQGTIDNITKIELIPCLKAGVLYRSIFGIGNSALKCGA